jgi:hypothetical protein
LNGEIGLSLTEDRPRRRDNGHLGNRTLPLGPCVGFCRSASSDTRRQRWYSYPAIAPDVSGWRAGSISARYFERVSFSDGSGSGSTRSGRDFDERGSMSNGRISDFHEWGSASKDRGFVNDE